MDFEKYYSDRQKLINNFLEKRMQKKGISRVDEAMAYSLFAGGKRIRPILLMATADAVGANGYNFLPVAAGLEMIHTYSLIHDDFDFENDDAKNVLLAETVPEVIRLLFDKLPKLEVLDGSSVKATFKAIQKETKLGGKNVFMPIRVALTGNQHGPELAEMVPLLGLARTVSRIKNSLDKVGVKLY